MTRERSAVRPAALLFVGLLVLQPAVAAATAPAGGTAAGPVATAAPGVVGATSAAPAPAQEGGTTNATDTGVGPADHVYVERDGDVVLVVNSSGNATGDLGDAGIDGGDGTAATAAAPDAGLREARVDALTREGLFYGLFVVDRTAVGAPADPSLGTTTSFATTVAPDRIAAGGTFGVARPDALRELRVDLDGARTTGRAGVTLDAVGTGRLSGSAAAGRLVERAEGNVYARFGPRNLTVRTNASARLTPAGASLADGFRYRALLTEEPGAIRLAVHRNTTVADAGNWSTVNRTRATLERRFLSGNVSSVSNASLTVQSHDYRNVSDGDAAGRVNVSYVVRYEGIRARLKPVATAALAADSNVSIGPVRAERLASDLLSVRVERALVAAEYRDGRFEGRSELRLREYDESLSAALDLAAAYNVTENETIGPYVEGFRKRFEAAREAGLVREYHLGATYDRPGDNLARVRLTGFYRTTDWDDYVAELRERDVRLPDVTFDLHARTDADRLRGNASVAVAGPGLLNETLSDLATLSRAAESDGPSDGDTGGEALDPDSDAVYRILRESGIQRARFAVNLTRETVRLEGGARVGDPGALRPLLRNETTGELPTDLRIERAVGRPVDEGRRFVLYVHAVEAVPRDATEAEVRALAAVTGNTTVHLPGTWDREFPAVDREGAYGFLGETPPPRTPRETPSPTASPTPPTSFRESPDDGRAGQPGRTDRTTGTTGGDGPGFGPLAALVAVAALALLARRPD